MKKKKKKRKEKKRKQALLQPRSTNQESDASFCSADRTPSATTSA
jgi:hypothetical protein